MKDKFTTVAARKLKMLSNTCKKSEEIVMFSLGGKSTNLYIYIYI